MSGNADATSVTFTKKRGSPSIDVAQFAEQVRAQKAAECERVPWSIAVRHCYVASKIESDASNCI
jgi:hypothetical protein